MRKDPMWIGGPYFSVVQSRVGIAESSRQQVESDLAEELSLNLGRRASRPWESMRFDRGFGLFESVIWRGVGFRVGASRGVKIPAPPQEG
jgi:hypothetical protein